MMILRPYQLEACAAVDAGEQRGIRRQIVGLPTGTGKTIVATETIRRRGGRALFVAHRDELIDQAVDKLRMIAPDVGIVKAERDDVDARIIVASVQTLARQSRIARIADGFNTIVVDEAHHGTADTYRGMLEYFGAFSADGPLTLGLTATPERADGAALGDVFEEIVYHADLLSMIRQRYLVDLRAVRIHIEADLDEVHTRAGDLVASELDAALRFANAPRHAVKAYQDHAPGRKALLFTPTVSLAYEMAAAFTDAGISAEALDGTVAKNERKEILARLHTGETKVVANCAMLNEGFDEPSIDCIIIARPTKSRPLYVQMIGRGTRLFPGKADCLIIDLVGTSRRHKLITVPTLFGFKPEELADGESVGEATGRRERLELDRRNHGRLVAETVDLFNSHQLHWVGTAPSKFILSVGNGFVVLRSADLTTWRVEHVDRDRERIVIGENLDLGYAQGAAEDYVRKLGAEALVNRTARWRQEQATEKQIVALRRWKIPIRQGLTKGEASDLLSAAVGRVAA